MSNPQPEALKLLKNARLAAERERQLRVQIDKFRRMAIVGSIAAIVGLGSLWISGCTFADGCTAIPVELAAD